VVPKVGGSSPLAHPRRRGIEPLDFRFARAASSTGQSRGLLIPRLQVRVLRGPRSIRWSKNRDAEDRLDMVSIPNSNLGNDGLHHGLAFGHRGLPKGTLNLPPHLSQTWRAGDLRPTPGDLFCKIRAPRLKCGELGREFLDPAGTGLLREPSLLERREVAVQSVLRLPDPRLHSGQFSLPPGTSVFGDPRPSVHGLFKHLALGTVDRLGSTASILRDYRDPRAESYRRDHRWRIGHARPTQR
jgi:hypothetical protein